MAEDNGEVTLKNDVSATDDDNAVKTDDYPKLIAYGLPEKVASKLDEIYRSGKENSFFLSNNLINDYSFISYLEYWGEKNIIEARKC